MKELILLLLPLHTTERELLPCSPLSVCLQTLMFSGRIVEEHAIDGRTIEK